MTVAGVVHAKQQKSEVHQRTSPVDGGAENRGNSPAKLGLRYENEAGEL
jgi:hypothetical protein